MQYQITVCFATDLLSRLRQNELNVQRGCICSVLLMNLRNELNSVESAPVCYSSEISVWISGGRIHHFCDPWFTWIHELTVMIQFNQIHIFLGTQKKLDSCFQIILALRSTIQVWFSQRGIWESVKERRGEKKVYVRLTSADLQYLILWPITLQS